MDTFLGIAVAKIMDADDILSPYIYVFYAAFLVSFVFTPIMRVVALYYGIIDQPDRVRKLHTVPVAYLGGIAVFLGWIVGVAVSQLITMHFSSASVGFSGVVNVRLSLIIPAAIIVSLGLWDDIRGLRPWMKITGQLLAAIIMLSDGIGTQATGPLLTPLFARLSSIFGTPIAPNIQHYIVLISSSMLVIAVIVGCCNATNLMDGLDGLCGGVTAVIAAGYLFLVVHMATLAPLSDIDVNYGPLRVVLALALLGGVLGFVPYNFNPASIFMGDTGSMFLGFSCGTLMILMAERDAKWFLAGMVMFALPIMDTTLAFARRYVNKRPLFSADRNHFHHQLVQRGFSVKQTVLISYGLSIAFALLGAAIVFVRTRYAVAIYLVIFGSIIVAAYKMGMVHEKPRLVTRRSLDPADASQELSIVEGNSVIEVRPDNPSTTGSSIVMPNRLPS